MASTNNYPSSKVFVGNFVHSTKENAFEILENAVLGVKDGRIVFVDRKERLPSLLEQHDFLKDEIIRLEEHQFLMPGLVDSHAHAPQYSFLGTGSDLELLPWLEKYTYPSESSVDKDSNIAKDVYRKCVRRTLKNGSTTVAYFATINPDHCSVLVDVILEQGQRALVGKVNMDQNCPDFYIESAEESLAATTRFIDETLSKKSGLVTPCVTPRFAVTCTLKLMSQLAEVAQRYQLPIQTHVSENQDEVQFVKSLFPETSSYTEAYDQTGLITNKVKEIWCANKTQMTILAHGVYLTEEELDLIKSKGAGISHCPNSNLSLSSGMMDLKTFLHKGLKVGLGTDFAGGQSPSMLDAIRRGVHVANMVSLQTGNHVKKGERITYKDLFRLATLGSSEVLGLDAVIGSFEVGKEFDALLIDPWVPGSPFDVFPGDSLEDIMQKFLIVGDDRNILKVFIQGKCVLNNQSQVNNNII